MSALRRPARPKSPRRLRYAAASNGPLAHNRAHGAAAAHAIAIYGADAVYSFIPKNACTTMRLSIALANGAIGSSEQFNWIHANNRTFTPSLSELVLARYTFAVLRCPFSRILSCYLDKIVGRYPPFWLLYESLERAVEPCDFTFRTFVEALASEAILFADEHWQPQTSLLVFERYDDLFDIADFPAAVARLKERIGLTVVDARPLSRHGTDKLTPTSKLGPDTKPLDILLARSKGRTPEPAGLFDDDLIGRVRTLYADDIALYERHFPGGLLF